jgi:hypothetical protein
MKTAKDMKAKDALRPMEKREWYIMLMTSNTRYLPSRCCGRTVYYMYNGDEICDQHRCTVITKWGDRCSRITGISDECPQHFSQNLKKMLGVCE